MATKPTRSKECNPPDFAGCSHAADPELYYRLVAAFINGINRRMEYEISLYLIARFDALRKQTPAKIS